MSHSSDHTLEAILTLAHADEDAKKYTAAGRPAAACPLTLVEETLTCAADFLLLQAISTFLERNKSAAPSHPQPAVVLCTFKQSGLHYSHIARKWGIPFAPLQASNSLYLIEDLSQDPTNAAASTAAASAAQLDAWFQTGTAEAAWNTPSPLHAFLSRVVALRRRHSALLVLIDDLHWLNLHATGGELEVYDAIVALQAALAQVDAEAAATAPPAAAPAVVARAAFSLDTSSTASAAPPAAASGTLSSSLLVVTHGDVPVSSTLSLLRRQSSTFIKLSALQTGYTKEISGVLTAQQHHRTTDFWTPMQRSHYKLTDSQVKISAPGHSSSTLQQ